MISRPGRRQHDLSQRAAGADAALRHGHVLRQRPGPGAEGRAGNVAAAVRPRGAAADSRRWSSPRRCRSWRRCAAAAPPRRQGIEWIGPDGSTWRQTYAARRGLAPYYNTLDPRVQEAMLAVVRELVRRYARHRRLPGWPCGCRPTAMPSCPGRNGAWTTPRSPASSATPGCRCRARGRAGSPPGPPSSTATSIAAHGCSGGPTSSTASTAASARRGGRGPARRAALPGRGRDALRRRNRGRAAARPAARRHAGRSLLLTPASTRGNTRKTSGIVLLRPERIVPGPRLNAQAVDLEINQMPDADAYFRGLPAPAACSSIRRRRSASPRSTRRARSSRATPGWSRRRCPSGAAEPAAVRPQPGGHGLAGPDRRRLAACRWARKRRCATWWRSIAGCPPVRFTAVGDGRGEAASQPVTLPLRQLPRPDLRLRRQRRPLRRRGRGPAGGLAGLPARELTGSRPVGPLRQRRRRRCLGRSSWGPTTWRPSTLSEPGVKLSPVRRSRCPAAVEAALAQRIRQLGVRAAALRSPLPLRVLDNPGFERPATAADPVPGWAVSRRLGVTVQLDKSQRPTAAASRSASPATARSPAWSAGRSIRPPRAGSRCRSGSAWPTPTGNRRCGWPWKANSTAAITTASPPSDNRTAPASPPCPSPPPGGQFIFQVDDLPLEGLSQLHVRFDLMGQGEVWVDDVQLFDLAFNERELRALYKLITLADVTLQNGQVGDCMRLLDGYWPRFLVQHVPLGAGEAVAARPPENRSAAPPPPLRHRRAGWIACGTSFPERLW